MKTYSKRSRFCNSRRRTDYCSSVKQRSVVSECGATHYSANLRTTPISAVHFTIITDAPGLPRPARLRARPPGSLIGPLVCTQHSPHPTATTAPRRACITLHTGDRVTGGCYRIWVGLLSGCTYPIYLPIAIMHVSCMYLACILMTEHVRYV
jgi:hypothetical protein